MSNASTTPVSAPPRPGAARTGEAVHVDLFKTSRDPAGEAAALREEARKLGVAFFVFFALIIGGISLLINGAHKRGAAAEVDPGRVVHDGAHPGPLGRVQLVWSDGQVTDPARLDYVDVTGDEPTDAERRALTRVRLRLRGTGAPLAEAWAAPVAGASVRAVRHAGVDDQALPSPLFAVRHAKLLRTVPTRFVISFGALMGLLGVLVPAVLVPFYGFWMRYVAAPLGWFNTRLILGIVFFLFFTPMALVLALRRLGDPTKDPLDRATRPGSYWRKRERQRPRAHFERTF